MLSQNISEQRKEERVQVEHLVRVGNTGGMTRDISASGVYFEADLPFSLGQVVGFAIEFGRQGVNFILKCVGEVVRVDERSGKSGVAVKILQSVMESA